MCRPVILLGAILLADYAWQVGGRCGILLKVRQQTRNTSFSGKNPKCAAKQALSTRSRYRFYILNVANNQETKTNKQERTLAHTRWLGGAMVRTLDL